MTLRVLFAGALAALPLLVSGALAQTAATPPAAATSPAPGCQFGEPARADPGESACRDGHINAAVHSGELRRRRLKAS